MTKLPDSLIEKLNDIPAEEILTMLSKPESIKELNLNFIEYLALISYMSDIINSTKDINPDVEKLKSENEELKTRLAYQEGRCKYLEDKIDSINDVIKGYEEDYE